MSLKRSAFNVFKASKEKGKSDADKHASPTKRIKISSSPSILTETIERNLVSSTPPLKMNSKKPPLKSKSEPRMNTLRKSLRKKQRKDSNQAVAIKLASSKENRAHKSNFRDIMQPYIHERPDLIKSSQQLKPGASLEEIFIPNVHKSIMDLNSAGESFEEPQALENTSPNSDDTDHTDGLEIGATDLDSCTDKKKISRTLSANLLTEVNGVEKRKTAKTKKRYSLDSNMHSRKKEMCDKKDSFSSISSVNMMTPVDEEMLNSSKKLFEWLVGPIDTNKFFSDVWEKKPLFIKRRQPMYNDGWFSTKEFESILRQHHLQYTRNIDIAVYKDGKRSTLNPEGRAHASNVWKFYQEGCSIRLLNPQSYSRNVWKFCSKLQEYFGCFVGTNMYLTPPSSQGFAPHFDDIEAFVIQLEGKKRWRLYNSCSLAEVLPRYSSQNLNRDQLGSPILDRVLEAGDTMYMPRGTIHEAVTDQGEHSLHITLSLYQHSCWADYLEKLIPAALSVAVEEDVDFRRGLPIGYLNQVGLQHADEIPSSTRSSFMKTVEHLMKKLVAYLPVDVAADQMAIDAIEEQLPPVLSEAEAKCSVHGNEEVSWETDNIKNSFELKKETEVRLIRPGVARLINEEDELIVYHSMENSRVIKEYAMQSLTLAPEEACAAEMLLSSFPNYISISTLPLDSDEKKVSLASRFYSHGLIRSKEPMLTDNVDNVS